MVSEVQEDNSHVAQNDEIGVVEDCQTSLDDQHISNILTLTENFGSWLEAVGKRFMKVEDHLIGLSIGHLNINFLRNKFDILITG